MCCLIGKTTLKLGVKIMKVLLSLVIVVVTCGLFSLAVVLFGPAAAIISAVAFFYFVLLWAIVHSVITEMWF